MTTETLSTPVEQFTIAIDAGDGRRGTLALDRNRAWRVPHALDIGAMRAAAQVLVGRHDFTTFRAAGCQARSPVKTLDRLDVKGDGE